MNVVYIVTASIIGTFILVLLLLFTLRRTQHFKRGLLYKQKGMIDDAIVEFEQAISSDPSNALAYWYLANLYEEKGLYGRAAELYQYMMDSQLIPMEVPFSEVHKRLAKCYFKAKRVQEAFIELKKLMMVEPEDPEPPFMLGVIYASQGLFDEAIGYFRIVIARKPRYPDAYFYLGLCQAAKGDFRSAAASVARAVKMAPDNMIYRYYLGCFHRENNVTNKAVEELKIVTVRSREEALKVQAYDLIGIIYIETRKAKEAVKTFEDALQRCIFTAELQLLRLDIMYNAGVAYAMAGETGKALDMWRKVKAVDSGYREVSKLPTSEGDFDLNYVLQIFNRTRSKIPIDTVGAPFIYIFPKVDLKVLEEEERAHAGPASSKKAAGTTKGIDAFVSLKTQEFRDVSKALLARLGFKVLKEIREKGVIDYVEGEGVDFIATKNGERYFVMVRRWKPTTPVGEVPIRELMAKMGVHKASKALFITTATVTDGARRLAEESNKVDIISGTRLDMLLRKVLGGS